MAADRRARWQTASPYLDTVLDLPPDEREAWLGELRSTNPALADQVADWLAACEAVDTSDFLEGAAVVEPSRTALAGLQLGAYRLVEPIGHGGMGTVWLAERADGRFEGRVAVKLLNAALVGRTGEERFAREGRILARLAHPRIAHLLDAGVSPVGQPYLVLEYVDGVPIDRYCDERRLDVEARLRLFLQVLDPVAHAHANLVVHRDLKPSNVLVSASGEPRLLDFGIARLLDAEDRGTSPPLLTREGDYVLTPAYSAPEQVRRDVITTATDVYALGVLLYLLLTGRHPAEPHLDDSAALLHAVVHVDPPRMSDRVRTSEATAPGSPAARASARGTTPDRLSRILGGDLDVIVAKALRKSPGERYASVLELAEDLRRHLAHQPIRARALSLPYRGARFVRRHRWSVAAATVVAVTLSAGLVLLNRQRAEAERRFEQVRALSNKLFDIDAEVRQLAGSMKTRQLIVDTALQYLRGLADDLDSEPELALDVATAFMRVARVQGVPVSTNLGQLDAADATLTQAEGMVALVRRRQPGNRVAILRSAQIAHDRMIIAGLRRPDDQALPLARRAAADLDAFLESGPVPPDELEQVLITLNNVGNRFRIERVYDEAMRLTTRGIALARADDGTAGRGQLGGLLIGLTRIHRDRGDLDAALTAIREAGQLLEVSADQAAQVQGRTATFVLALSTEGQILYDPYGISLDRPAEAAVPFQRGFDLLDPLVHRDPANAEMRGRLSSIGRNLAGSVAATDPERALAIYDHVLQHLGEVSGNARFRRDEVRALAASSGVLRVLGRPGESRQRIAAAFDRLAALKLYPAERVEPGSEADDALTAQAEDQVARGRLGDGIATYQRLLELVMASGPDPESDMTDAHELSRIYGRLATLLHRAGEGGRAAELVRRRIELWERWDRQTPGHATVTSQLARARRALDAPAP